MKRKITSLCLSIILILSVAIVPGYQAKAAEQNVTVDYEITGGQHVFTVTNNNENDFVYYTLMVDGVAEYNNISVSPQEVAVPAAPLGTTCNLFVDDENGETIATANSQTANDFTVYATDENGNHLNYYLGDGNETTDVIESGTVDNTSRKTVVGPEVIYTPGSDGVDREWRTSESAVVEYGVSEYTIRYSEVTKDSKKFTLKFIDENGNEIETKDVVVPYEDGKGVGNYTIEEKIKDKNGREYELQKPEEAKEYSVGYYDDMSEREYSYKLVTQEVKDDYVVSVESIAVDEKGNDLGAILGVDTFTYNDNNEVPYTYTARDSFSVRNDADGTISYYHLFDNKEKTLEHKAGDTATHQVRYIKDSSKTAYDWVINGIDVETNQVIFTDSKNIVPGANEDYKAKTEVTFDDNDYILDTNAANVYYHTYDVNGERTTYIPYHKVDAKTKTSYDIKVQYVDVKTLEVIESKTVKATAKDNGVMITSPDKIKEGKDSYVRIQGEVDEKQHEFYMPQRTYSIFYRDVNDIQSASITKNVVYDETVYTEKTVEQPVDVIATETETVEGGPSTAAATSDQNPEVSAPDSLLVNGKTGETVLVDEKGAEKAKSVQNLKDGEVPLGKGSGDQDNSAKAQVAAVTSSLPFIVGVSLAGLAILFLIILFFYKKRKNGNIGTNDK